MSVWLGRIRNGGLHWQAPSNYLSTCIQGSINDDNKVLYICTVLHVSRPHIRRKMGAQISSDWILPYHYVVILVSKINLTIRDTRTAQ